HVVAQVVPSNDDRTLTFGEPDDRLPHDLDLSDVRGGLELSAWSGTPVGTPFGQPAPAPGGGKVERGAVQPRLGSIHRAHPIPPLPDTYECVLGELLGHAAVAAGKRQGADQAQPHPVT